MAKTISVLKVQQGLAADGVPMPRSFTAQTPHGDGVWGPETELHLGRWLDRTYGAGAAENPAQALDWNMRPSADGRTVTIEPTRAVVALERLAGRFASLPRGLPTPPGTPPAVTEHLTEDGSATAVMMPATSASKAPWIVGGVVALFVIGGGIWLASRRP